MPRIPVGSWQLASKNSEVASQIQIKNATNSSWQLAICNLQFSIKNSEVDSLMQSETSELKPYNHPFNQVANCQLKTAN
jgi:hypothetical protein